MRRIWQIFLVILAMIFIIFLLGVIWPQPPKPPVNNNITFTPVSNSRTFYMGFTAWPPDFTADSVNKMNEYIANHADIIAFHFDNAVPWQEAYEDKDYSTNLMNEWKNKKSSIPSGHKVYVAITPLDMNRENLQNYWGDNGAEPLSSPWSAYALNDEHVKTACLNYAKKTIQYFNPDYFAIGLEVNILIEKDSSKWEQYKELQQYVYTELKKDYPNLLIFSTIQLSYLNGVNNIDSLQQQSEVGKLMPYNDIVGLSAYPYGWDYWRTQGKLNSVPETWFDYAKQHKKPIAITETGAPSESFKSANINFKFDETYQANYFNFLFRKAVENNFIFIVNYNAIDFDKLLSKLNSAQRDFAVVWAYDGMEKSDFTEKQAAHIWDAYFNLPKI